MLTLPGESFKHSHLLIRWLLFCVNYICINTYDPTFVPKFGE